MSYIYMDESGDLGFNPQSTRYFIVTFLISEKEKDVDDIMKKTYRWMKNTGKKKQGNFFHSYKEHKKSTLKLLSLASKEDIKICTLIIKKKKIYHTGNSNTFYDASIGQLLEYCIEHNIIDKEKQYNFIASRKYTNKKLNNNFMEYIEHIASQYSQPIYVQVAQPTKFKGLQVVDALSYAIFQKFEHSNDIFYDIIEGSVVIYEK